MPLQFFRLPMLVAVGVCLAVLSIAGCTARVPAHDFQVVLFDGQDFSLSEQAGKSAVVLNFWYPSCAPCREEMPHFQQAWQEFEGKDIRFLGLFVPRGFDSEQDARDFVDQYGLTFNFAVDRRQAIAQQYGVEFFPTTYFIDRKGQVERVEISNLDRDTIVDIVSKMDLG